MNKNIEIVLALAGGLVVGLVIGKNSALAPMGASDQSEKIQKLEQKIEQAKKYFPPVQADVRSIFGTITTVQDNSFAMKVLSGNPFDESPRIRNVTVGSQTKVTHNEQKDAIVFEQELAVFQKTLRSQAGKPSSSPLTQPSPFRETPGQLADIKPGQQVTITTAENIRDKESFTAVVVNIYVPSGPPNTTPSSKK